MPRTSSPRPSATGSPGSIADRRSNLMRKELAWLRRGPPARTSKPKFRIDAANALIADEPPPRNSVELASFASRRLGKDVLDLEDATVSVGEPPNERRLLDHVTWRLAPGERIGIVGVNGAGKSTLLRALTGEIPLDAGRRKIGKTVAIAHLTRRCASSSGSSSGASSRPSRTSGSGRRWAARRSAPASSRPVSASRRPAAVAGRRPQRWRAAPAAADAAAA